MISQPPPPVVVPKGRRRKGLIVLGLILLFGGLLGGGAIVGKGMANYKEAVKSLARAPAGCTTTLVFDKPATFTVYAETKGKLGQLSGDCEANGSDYSHPGDKLPRMALTLTDPNGGAVDMQRGITASYDVGGYIGTGIRTMQIEQAGTYHLNVESDDSDFAVAIGKNPKDDSDKLLTIGGGVALGGFLVGLLLFLLGLRRRRPEPAFADIRTPGAPMPGWPPAPYATAPPSASPAPPPPPGFAPQPPPAAQPIGVSGPPIRLPQEPPTPAFGPPTFAPPVLPTRADGPPTTAPPTGAPPTGAPPTSGPPTLPPISSPPSSSGWARPDDDDDDD
ncbi:MAG: hypothetical protein ABI862_16100 [Ilumatobacteraceae bacterium]